MFNLSKRYRMKNYKEIKLKKKWRHLNQKDPTRFVVTSNCIDEPHTMVCLFHLQSVCFNGENQSELQVHNSNIYCKYMK